MSLFWQFAIRNKLLYSGFVLPNVEIFFVQKISFATFGVSIDEFFARYAGLGYSLKVKYGMSTVHDGLYRISQPRRFSFVLPDRAILFALPVLGYNGYLTI